ncbi:MAG: hypothetical protein KatS3mg074_204 [Meiothermus sp.]|nr:MAG: hypothetical protein KatS3mg074_204 [Meiothermus sp.]
MVSGGFGLADRLSGVYTQKDEARYAKLLTPIHSRLNVTVQLPYCRLVAILPVIWVFLPHIGNILPNSSNGIAEQIALMVDTNAKNYICALRNFVCV